MKKGYKIENYFFIFLIIFLIIFSFILLFKYFNNEKVIDKKQIYTELIIGDKVGVAKNNSALIFGGIRRNGSSSKEINLLNNYGEDVKVEIVRDGNISEFIYVSENDFLLRKGESKNLTFVAKSFPNSEYGKYTGNVYIIIKRI